MEDLYLVHHGIKGQRWGIRRFQRKDGTVTPAGKKRYQTGDEKAIQKEKRIKALKIGAVATGAVLAAYGGYKLSKTINKKNTLLASHVGSEFGSAFYERSRPKSPLVIGAMGMNRYAIGQNTAQRSGAIFGNKVSEKIASSKGVKKIKNAFSASQISRGKKTAFDLFNYDEFANQIISDEKVFSGGQSEFAKLARDTINMGGYIPKPQSSNKMPNLTLNPGTSGSSNINDMILKTMNQATSQSNEQLKKGMNALRRK